MKLPKPGARLLAPGGGNLKLQAAPGEVHVNAFSDGSSTLPTSTKLITGRTQADRVYALATGFVLVSKIASKP